MEEDEMPTPDQYLKAAEIMADAAATFARKQPLSAAQKAAVRFLAQ